MERVYQLTLAIAIIFGLVVSSSQPRIRTEAQSQY